MKKQSDLLRSLSLFAVIMFLFASFGFSQQTVLLTESFESGNGTTPPAGWTIEQVTGTTLGVSFVTSSSNPTITAAYDGTRFAMYNSFNISSGSTRLKRSTPMSTTNNSFVMVEFAWYEDPGYASSADRVDVQWSTNGTTWNTAATLNRYNAVAGWKAKNVILPAGAAGQVNLYVAFLFTSANGNNCNLDMVKVTAGPLSPPAFVTIGTGTTTVGWPYYTFYMGSRTQMLYTAAQLTAGGASAGNLLSVGFNVATAYPQVMQNFTIKMGATTSATLTGWVTTGMNTVYQQNYGVPGTGWRDIMLTTPFNWNGTSNVIVEICFGDNGSYTNNTLVYGTSGTGTTWHYHADNYSGCTGAMGGAVSTPTPNIRFGIPPFTPGALMGYVKDCNTGTPISGALVSVGAKVDTSDANGFYMIYNLTPGQITVNVTATGYIASSNSATIIAGQVTTLNLLPCPGPKVGGIVTDASTGLPVIGAEIKIDGQYLTMSVAGGSYLTPLLSIQGIHTIEISKTGYDSFTGAINLVANTTATFDAALLPTAVPPGQAPAILNGSPGTSVTLSWPTPRGMYELIYDDGIQDNLAIWANANNLNALKFTALNYPIKLMGGKVNLGAAANYPANAPPLTPFTMMAMKADGTSGMPGTIIDSVTVTPSGFGWVSFSFASPLNITSGDFYLVMKQGGIAPHAAGLGVDLTNTALRSYSKFVTGGALWVPAAGNFMMRAIVEGEGGPMDAALAPTTITYQAWRLRHGQENNQAMWISIYTGNSNTTTDQTWPILPCGPWRWAVKAIYSPPGQRPSPPSFTNVIGKCWTASVNVCVSLTCPANPKAGTIVKLINADYPDTNYTATTDTSGCVSFNNVWLGNYSLQVLRFTYPLYTQNITIMDDTTMNLILQQEAIPPSNLAVDNQSLKATWNPPRTEVFQLNEDFIGGFGPNQWTISGGSNWGVSTASGNPAPSAMFSWTPQVTIYNQYLTSKSLAGIHAPQMRLKYDIYLDNFGTTSLNTMAVELWNGSNWQVLKTYENSGGSIAWMSETLNISSQTHNPDFRIRFHASGTDSYDINNWNVDNVQVYSTDGNSGPNPCVIGYNFYLCNVLSAFTTDTMYNIPPNQLVYGQTCNACVKAVYGSGYSPEICVSFMSKFLYPARDLIANAIECNTCLTWKKPVTMADSPDILSIVPRKIDPNSAVDASPFEIELSKVNNNSETIWDVLFAWNCTPASGAGAGQAGIETQGDFIYTSVWGGTNTGPPWFSKYQKTTGVLVEAFDIPGATAVRDMAFDGTHFYGSAASSSLFKMNFTTKTLVSTISTGVSAIRHIAYDPANAGFWVGDWATMSLINATTGTVIAAGPAMSNAYGSAYDNDPAGGPYLWVHAQTGTPADQVEKWKITGTALSNTGISHNLGTVPGFPSGGIAGGLCSGDVGTKFALMALVQGTPNFVCALELRAGGGGGGSTPAGLIGYNVYRDGNFIHYRPHPDSLMYCDYALEPGTYTYDVTAKYDLTPYGFAGQTGESLGNTAGPQTVVLNCCCPLPFYEPWDNGTFSYNSWQPNGHWTINTGIGNPAPTADFHWDPAITNYSQALTSRNLNLSDWNCAKIWLDFDVKLIDLNSTGKEKLSIDIFYDGAWHQKMELSNNGSTNWVPKHINISEAKGKGCRIRFVASGENSGDMMHWYVDNIQVYAICNPPKTLFHQQIYFTTKLTWQAPDCDQNVPMILVKLFQWAGTPDNGYYQNYNYGYGVVYNLTSYPIAMLNKIDFHHASWGTTGTWQYKIHVVDWTTFTEIATLGPLTTTGDDKWENNVPLGNIPGAGGKMIGIMLEPMGNSPTDAYPCFSADNVGPDGVSVFGMLPDYSAFAPATIGDFLQNLWIDVPAGDGMTHVLPEKVPFSEVVQDESDSSVLIGYNVYRTGNNGQLPYTKLNSSIIPATTYSDVHPYGTPWQTWWRYYVESVYFRSSDYTPLCTSSSDTIQVDFWMGVNEISDEQIAIYPNPASDVVNMKSDNFIQRIEMLNFTGQNVYTREGIDAKVYRIDVAAMPPGVYFMKVTTTKGSRIAKLAVIR